MESGSLDGGEGFENTCAGLVEIYYRFATWANSFLEMTSFYRVYRVADEIGLEQRL